MTRLVFTLAIGLWLIGIGRDSLDRWVDTTVLPPLTVEVSAEVLDRNGDLLRAYTVADGRWRMTLGLDAVDPDYLAMLVRYEDKRFYDHNGVDMIAMLRSAGLALKHGEIVSGGSTLTMQVARLLEDGPTGQWRGKLRQIRVALALERQLSKDEILTLYLNRAPFGGNIEGVRAASYAYFNRPPRRLTPAQSALLVALPQSPEVRRPDRNPAAATTARNRVLARMLAEGVIDASTQEAASRHAVAATRHAFPAIAPHLADRAMAEAPHQTHHDLTLDRRLQLALEILAAQATSGRSDRLQVAIVVADHKTGEMLASVGSAAYRADGRAGFIDLTRAVRSPGSTLKPVVYGLGFEQGMIHPETLILDRPTVFDGYAPQNFDGLYRGELRVRTALQLSLNIPVVSVTEALGPHHLIAGLRRAGADPQVPGGAPGLAVALGGVGLTLNDLVQVYGGIANEGVAMDLRWRESPTAGFAPQQIMGDVAAWQVADILRNVPRPVGVQGSGIAFKTGTSYGHRDAWSIGFDGQHVIGVWMGRADGTPVPGAFGGDLAAPVMFAAFARVAPEITPIGAPPPATLLLPTAQLPLPLQQFRGRHVIEPGGGPEIAFPPDGAVIEGVDLLAKVRDGVGPFTWLANGTPVATTRHRELVIHDLGRGFSALTVIDAQGRTDRTQVQLR
ncbi:penicillin-binding protein 1C [Cognatiyoonia koreensis]|uniref:peptidoglycan glycosyltransferase n=1 Tax=Cognatiyoonia koreensis TaxID=364200 RepID=A0A1I0RVK1_9RHOB|nr:penicillin-binding protein 1C [Cognatiyoonia koreensis]SEW45434.1 penicillin-binding protein 1C [Cognatiyoonia koreensis]